MNNGRKIKPKFILQLIFTALFFIVTLNCTANYSYPNRFCKILTAWQDTLPIAAKAKDSLSKDTIIQKTDTFGLKISKDSLDAPINYSASDSV
ncbi:MAG TPA: LPS-assembly protein LptD, partial [Puia sp.]|nr:LPS-assembly protein LptD [Puia sp.]